MPYIQYTLEEKIKMVARAMAEADGLKPDEMVPNMFGDEIPKWEGYKAQARRLLAAIKAMKEIGQI